MRGKWICFRIIFGFSLGLLTGCGGEPYDPALLMDLPEGKTVAEALAGKMIRADGSVAVFEKGKEPDYFVFYFSASWCPPCRAYTPKLVTFYEGQQGKGKAEGASFEVILIGEDNNQEAMLAYMRDYKMTWLAMEFEERGMRGVPMNPVRAIPAVVIVDNAGKVIDDSKRTSLNTIMQTFAGAHL
jgi:thiol-disulfide isomerase/thioredoxin